VMRDFIIIRNMNIRIKMLHFILSKFSQKYLSRWFIFSIDILLIFVLFYVAYFLRFNFQLQHYSFEDIHFNSLLTSVVYGLLFILTGSHKSIIRQTRLDDIYLLFKALSYSLGVILLIKTILELNQNLDVFNAPLSIFITHYLVLLFFLIGLRFSIKTIFHLAHKQANKPSAKVNVLIYGSGAAGLITKESLAKESHVHYKVIAFIDDNPSKQGKILDGIPIHKKTNVFLESFIARNSINQLIIAVQKIDKVIRKEIIQEGVDLGLEVKVVPPVSAWIQGELTSKQIKSVKIEDLLEREPIQMNSVNLKRSLCNKIVLVTGAAGSIGSEITRQILTFKPNRLIAIDLSESALYDLKMELLHDAPELHSITTFIVSDIRKELQMERLFKEWMPQMVFHAAAYKHVPLMELHPYEAIQVNVLGTKNIVDMAIKYGVEKFIMVSTDKAVNPTNVMGATKRLAEMYIQNANDSSSTKFIITRFGNALGGIGCVIPLIEKQIEKGGTVNIPHPNITQYIMTIPEACNLVLEAGAMGDGGEIYVFDMGKPIKIIDLAKNMIRLSGLKVDSDVKILFTGLRPGEKLYEELLAQDESTKPTQHQKILIADTRPVNKEQLLNAMDFFLNAINRGDDLKLVDHLKRFIPEYKSNNSLFSNLDKAKIKIEINNDAINLN
jgi:FlaA1/EpsC-like NDP-sugar epimerase